MKGSEPLLPQGGNDEPTTLWIRFGSLFRIGWQRTISKDLQSC